MDTKDVLLKLAAQFEEEAAMYHRMGKEGEPLQYRQEWEGVARGLDRAKTVLFAVAYEEERQ